MGSLHLVNSINNNMLKAFLIACCSTRCSCPSCCQLRCPSPSCCKLCCPSPSCCSPCYPCPPRYWICLFQHCQHCRNPWSCSRCYSSCCRCLCWCWKICCQLCWHCSCCQERSRSRS